MGGDFATEDLLVPLQLQQLSSAELATEQAPLLCQLRTENRSQRANNFSSRAHAWSFEVVDLKLSSLILTGSFLAVGHSLQKG